MSGVVDGTDANTRIKRSAKGPVKSGVASERITLREIAELAGVSKSTASLVLSGKAEERRISQEVVRRVREVAQQQDYVPNLLVRSLQRGQTYLLSFYSGYGIRKRNDLYMDSISGAIERAASALGYDVLVHCNYSRPADETYRMLNGGHSDGLLFYGPQFNNPLLPLLRNSRLPTVILNRVDEQGVLSSVTDDMPGSIRQVVETLVGLGHRRIAAISSYTGPWTPAPGRIALLQTLLAERGLPIPENWIVPVYDDSPLDPEGALRYLMAEPEPPTALFCWNDRVGYEMLEACERLGIAVPERLSLIGYDGLRWPSASRHVLASMPVPMDKIAEEAVDLLHRMIVGQIETPVHKSLPVSLDAGTTLAPPPGGRGN